MNVDAEYLSVAPLNARFVQECNTAGFKGRAVCIDGKSLCKEKRSKNSLKSKKPVACLAVNPTVPTTPWSNQQNKNLSARISQHRKDHRGYSGPLLAPTAHCNRRVSNISKLLQSLTTLSSPSEVYGLLSKSP